MGVKEAVVTYVVLVFTQFAQAVLTIEGKKAVLSGMNNFALTFYANAITGVILLPTSFLIQRSSRPPLSFSLLVGVSLVALLGFMVQIIWYVGLQYASASIASAMLNLIPGFTFVLVIIFRMENVHWRSKSTLFKSMGTVLSIVGALIVTLYNGPQILKMVSHSTSPDLMLQQSNWVIGGLLMAIDSLLASVFLIALALLVKKFPAELFIMFFYCCVVATLSAAVGLAVERDWSSWSLQSNTRLIAVIYSGLFGPAFQLTIGAWCLRRRGPLFVAMFNPLGVVIATAMGVIFLGDAFYVGSLLGSIVIFVGFYSVMLGKAEEGKMVADKGVRSLDSSTSQKTPLLQIHVVDQLSPSVTVIQ